MSLKQNSKSDFTSIRDSRIEKEFKLISHRKELYEYKIDRI